VISSLLKALPFPQGQTVSLIDVGARWGANPPWNQLDERYLTYVGFEPDEEECRNLIANRKSAHVEYIPVGLSDDNEERMLHVTREPGCSSIFPPNHELLGKYCLSDRWDVRARIPIKTRPLAAVLEERRIAPDALKIDVQGAALVVLKGAGESLDDILLIDVEVEFEEMYRGEPLFGEVDRLVRQHGFQLLDLNKYYARRKILDSRHLSRGQVLFADALYVKTAEKFYAAHGTPEHRSRKLWNMIVMLCLYGHFDVALEFALHPESPLSELDRATLRKVIGRHTAIAKWKLLLLDNAVSEKVGLLLSLLGNALQIRSRRSGWGSDLGAVDTRYKYFFTHPILNLFRK
jgi:FkbM family methyltransferase